METLDTLIIGAGSAGLAALREVRKQTERFAIINDGPWGTTCARVGCMPSKVLIEAANAYHRREAFDTFGIRGAQALQVDLPAVLDRVRSLRDRFVSGVLSSTQDLGDRAISGRARLTSPTTVEVNGRSLAARSIIVAPGSSPVLPPEWQALGVLTTDTLFEQPHLGPRLAVLGLGAIGVEMAQALARLGLRVTAFSRHDALAALTDDAVAATLREQLAREFTLHTGHTPTLRATAGGIEVQAGPVRLEVDHVLAATGRPPNLQGLGLAALGVALDDKGLPRINPHTLQVADLPVFMAGDATLRRPLLHEAADDGYIAGHNALAAHPQAFMRRTPLGIVFSEPGSATVGQRFADLEPGRFVTGAVNFRNQGRARAAQRNQGLLHVYACRSTGRLLGAELCAPAGEHLAHLLALALHQQMTVQDMLGMPFYHPVLEEGLRTALRDAARQLPGAGPASDLAHCPAQGCEALD